MFRFETFLIAAVLASPVAALWLRGDFHDADVWWRFGLCWIAAWAATTLLALAARPPAKSPDDPDDLADLDGLDASDADTDVETATVENTRGTGAPGASASPAAP